MEIKLCKSCVGLGKITKPVMTRGNYYEDFVCIKCNGTGRIKTRSYSYSVPFNTNDAEIIKLDSKIFDLIRGLENNQNYVKCFDKFGKELKEGDIVDVQRDGEHEIYKKEDGQLYFAPYEKEDRVSAYFSNDLIKVEN